MTGAQMADLCEDIAAASEKMVIDRLVFGSAVAEVTYEKQPDGSMMPVKFERVPPPWVLQMAQRDRSLKHPKQYRLKHRAAGAKRRNKRVR